MGGLRLTGVWLVCLAGPVASGQGVERPPELERGTSRYTFIDPRLPERPIEVHTYKPARYEPTSPVLFVMHGMTRNADQYRDDWISYAFKYRVLLVVPEFSRQHFATSRAYNCGNVSDSGGTLKPREEWSFTAIERIFDDVVDRSGNRSKRYYLYGHSAGAQFVHRMLLQLPSARVERAVCANAGSYSMPSFEVAYPYGLAESAATPEGLARSLGIELVVMLGKLDTDERSSSLPRSSRAMAQGPHRLARGKSFFAAGRAAAEAADLDLSWELEVVTGVGHSNSGMARAAAKALFD